MESGERHHVDGQFTQVGIKLTGEPQTSGDTGHDDGDEVVQVTVSGGVEFESSETDVVQGFIVDTEGLV